MLPTIVQNNLILNKKRERCQRTKLVCPHLTHPLASLSFHFTKSNSIIILKSSIKFMRHNDISMQKVKFLHLKLSTLYIYFVITYVMIFSFRLNSNRHLHTFYYHEQFINWHNNSLANMTNVN